MKRGAVIFYWGALISFIGSMPPGILNIGASQIATGENYWMALEFAGGATLAEVIVVRIALSGMNWLSRNRKFFRLLEWVTVCLLLIFSLVCFITAVNRQDFSGIATRLINASFFTGFFLSLINPLHIPFWMGWTTVLMNKEVLRTKTGDFNWYIAGIGSGTLCGFSAFIYGGTYLLDLLSSNQLYINCLFGLLLLIIAFLQIRKMVIVPVVLPYKIGHIDKQK